MAHISISPPRGSRPVAPKEARWRLLDLVRDTRAALGLRDRDVTLLRGLLSLLPTQASGGQLVVFASNRVLSERCDGIDERTLRRRLAHLERCGLVQRRRSPNGKRYQVRDAQAAVLTYGIDLSPLYAIEAHLTALAAQLRHAALHAKALRALIRDWLYHHPQDPRAEEARLSLRRKLDDSHLQDLCDGLMPAGELTASDSQNDRHIQSSDKEDFDKEAKTVPGPLPQGADMSLAECLDLAKTARDMAPVTPQTWPEVVDLARALAPAIGIGAATLRQAQAQLGPQGSALAVLGLVQAFDRIRKPEAYLSALIRRAAVGGVDIVRMFRSLARPICIPG